MGSFLRVHHCVLVGERGRGMALLSAILTVGASMMFGANGKRGLGRIYDGRLFTGIGVDGYSSLATIFIFEIFPRAIRDQLIYVSSAGQLSTLLASC